MWHLIDITAAIVLPIVNAIDNAIARASTQPAR